MPQRFIQFDSDDGIDLDCLDRESCWQCGGSGVCMVGVDIDQDDPVNNFPPKGESITCP